MKVFDLSMWLPCSCCYIKYYCLSHFQTATTRQSNAEKNEASLDLFKDYDTKMKSVNKVLQQTMCVVAQLHQAVKSCQEGK